MNNAIKNFVVEFFQATGFATCVGFIIVAFVGDYRRHDALVVSLIFGAIPVMLAKRFILSFIKQCREQ